MVRNEVFTKLVSSQSYVKTVTMPFLEFLVSIVSKDLIQSNAHTKSLPYWKFEFLIIIPLKLIRLSNNFSSKLLQKMLLL